MNQLFNIIKFALVLFHDYQFVGRHKKRYALGPGGINGGIWNKILKIKIKVNGIKLLILAFQRPIKLLIIGSAEVVSLKLKRH